MFRRKKMNDGSPFLCRANKWLSRYDIISILLLLMGLVFDICNLSGFTVRTRVVFQSGFLGAVVTVLEHIGRQMEETKLEVLVLSLTVLPMFAAILLFILGNYQGKTFGLTIQEYLKFVSEGKENQGKLGKRCESCTDTSRCRRDKVDTLRKRCVWAFVIAVVTMIAFMLKLIVVEYVAICLLLVNCAQPFLIAWDIMDMDSQSEQLKEALKKEIVKSLQMPDETDYRELVPSLVERVGKNYDGSYRLDETIDALYTGMIECLPSGQKPKCFFYFGFEITKWLLISKATYSTEYYDEGAYYLGKNLEEWFEKDKTKRDMKYMLNGIVCAVLTYPRYEFTNVFTNVFTTVFTRLLYSEDKDCDPLERAELCTKLCFLESLYRVGRKNEKWLQYLKEHCSDIQNCFKTTLTDDEKNVIEEYAYNIWPLLGLWSKEDLQRIAEEFMCDCLKISRNRQNYQKEELTGPFMRLVVGGNI